MSLYPCSCFYLYCAIEVTGSRLSTDNWEMPILIFLTQLSKLVESELTLKSRQFIRIEPELSIPVTLDYRSNQLPLFLIVGLLTISKLTFASHQK